MGYSYTEVTREPDKSGKMKVTKKVTRKVASEVVAMIFWLKNRRPALWRDRKDVRHGGAILLEFDSVIYEAVNGNGNGKSGGNGKSISAPAVVDS